MRTSNAPGSDRGTPARRHRAWLPAIVLAIGLAPAAARAETAIASVPVGDGPSAVAVDPVTGKVFVANAGSGTVTVIDATHHRTRTVAVGARPAAIGVNPASGKMYVANADGSSVTIMDAASLATTTVFVGATPGPIAVNPVTNRAYVASRGSGADNASVAVIDATGNTIATIGMTGDPSAIAVNAVTNRIYVANRLYNQVMVIDGATNATTTIDVGPSPVAIAVNPVTNRIHVANFDGGGITVIDGNTTESFAVETGHRPVAVAVNPATNRIYVSNYGVEPEPGGDVALLGSVTVINGADNSAANITGIFNPTHIELDVATDRIYVRQGPSWGGIAAIDGASGTLRAVVSAEWGGGGFAVSPVTHRIYAANTRRGDVYVTDGSTNASATVAAGMAPAAVAVNPVTGRIYVANSGGGSVTVIDGANATATVPAGTQPLAVAANPVTGKVYVANGAGNDVTVIDGATNATATVAAGGSPRALAVNEITNRIYVANAGSNDVTVIEGANNATTTVAAGLAPRHVAVTLADNRIYVANSGSNDVTVIDGATHATSTIAVGITPVAIAANPYTGKVYVANQGSNNVTVIDAATGATATIAVGASPGAIAVNPETDRIYVANRASLGVSIIDGVTTATTTVHLASSPVAIAVNPVTNRVYVAHEADNRVTMIDGIGNVATTIDAGAGPASIAVNPVTDRIYAANRGGNDVTVISATTVTLAAHGAGVTVPGGHVTNSESPAFTLFACCDYSPANPPVRTVYLRTGDAAGAYTKASGTGPYTANLTSLPPGLNFVTLFAADAMEGSSQNGMGSPIIGAPRVFALTVAPPLITTPSRLPIGIVGTAYSQVIAANSVTTPGFSVTGGVLPAGLSLSPEGLLAGTPTQAGYFTFTVTVTGASGGSASRDFALAILTTNTTRLINLSTRMQVQTGHNVLIGGFVIGGVAPKTVLVRARGPSLGAFGIADTLANPQVQLFSGQTVVAGNDDWVEAGNAAAIAASGLAPESDLESAILVTLAPGPYTAVMSGVGGSTGVGIVEIFEIDTSEAPLINLSTRGNVLTGDDVMIGGFVISGTTPQTVIVRARGPSLVPFGISNVLANPVLQLFSGQTMIAANDDWQSDPGAAAVEASGLAPASTLEAALRITLAPGPYTVIVTGAGGSTGVGIVEVFSQ